MQEIVYKITLSRIKCRDFYYIVCVEREKDHHIQFYIVDVYHYNTFTDNTGNALDQHNLMSLQPLFGESVIHG